MLPAGIMRHRIDIETLVDEQDELGQPSLEFTTTATSVPAQVLPAGGTEAFASRQLNPEITHVVRMRYYGGLGPKNRLLWEGKYLDIRAAENPDGRRVEHRVMCVERVGGE